MNILITGNLGYIGSELSRIIKSRYGSKCKIIGFDSGLFSNNITVAYVNPSTVDIQIYGDVRNISPEILKNIDYVIHLAAISNDPIGNKFKKVTLETNYLSTKKIYELSLINKVKKFIYASSCSMYGFSNVGDLTEDCKLNPLTDYAKSKVLSEEFLLDAAQDCKVVSLRFATATGPSERLRLDLLINEITYEAIFNKRITLKSNGQAYRPFIDVSDMCNSIIFSIERDLPNSFEAFNVGLNENNYSVFEIATMVAKITNLQSNHIKIGESLDSRSYNVDFSKYKKMLCKEQMMPIDLSIRNLHSNILNNIDIISSSYVNLKRLNKIENLINSKLLDDDLNWIIHEDNYSR